MVIVAKKIVVFGHLGRNDYLLLYMKVELITQSGKHGPSCCSYETVILFL